MDVIPRRGSKEKLAVPTGDQTIVLLLLLLYKPHLHPVHIFSAEFLSNRYVPQYVCDRYACEPKRIYATRVVLVSCSLCCWHLSLILEVKVADACLLVFM